MTVMRVAAANGYVLTYDTDDVEDFEVSTKADHREVGVTPSGYVKRELTDDHHLTLRIDFKHGKKALWVTQADAALPDLRSTGRFLTEALDAEGVDPAVASRIFNRVFFGNPDGLDAPPRRQPDVEREVAAMNQRFDEALARSEPGFPIPRLTDRQFPADQTAGERMATMVEAAGFGPQREDDDA